MSSLNTFGAGLMGGAAGAAGGASAGKDLAGLLGETGLFSSSFLGALGPIGALVGFGGGTLSSVLSAGQNSRAARKAKKQRDRIRRISDTLMMSTQARNELDRRAAEQAVAQQLANIDTAETQAMSSLNERRQSGVQSIMDNQQRMSGAATQAINQRGLGSSTVAASAQRGVASDTSRRLGEFESSLAGLAAEFGSTFAAMRNQTLASKLGFLSQIPGQRMGMTQMRHNAMTDFVDTATPTTGLDVGAFGSALGTVAKTLSTTTDEQGGSS